MHWTDPLDAGSKIIGRIAGSNVVNYHIVGTIADACPSEWQTLRPSIGLDGEGAIQGVASVLSSFAKVRVHMAHTALLPLTSRMAWNGGE